MATEPGRPGSANHQNGLPRDPPASADENYDPGETLGRGMSIACSLILLFFALVSCGFIASVLSSHH
jgi:hypothetical protein